MNNTLPTLKEIARRLNISVSTASRALHDHYSIGLRTKMRVHQLASELNYEPNQAAILFKKKRTSMIGVILPSLCHEYFAAIVNGIEDVAYKHNYTVLLCQSRDDAAREKQLVEAMKANRVDGMLISIAKNTTNYEHFEMLKKYNIPVVFFDRIPKMPDIHYITARLETGMIEAVSFLIKKKHLNIALLNGPEKLPACQERLLGYMNAHKKNRRKVDPRNIVSSDLSREGTYAAMEQLLSLKRRPTAIIVFNDYVAMDAIKYAKALNIEVNKDIYFVSFANVPFCDYMDSPPIASVEQFPYLQGEKGTEILLQLLAAHDDQTNTGSSIQSILLQSKLVVHESK